MIYEYQYEVNVDYRYNNNTIVIPTTNIKSLLIDYNYDENIMPITILTLIVDKNIKDIIIRNKDIGTFYIVTYKFIKGSDFKIKEEFIKEEFIYFLSDNTNKTSSIDYNDSNRLDVNDKLIVGLVKQSLVNNNKRNIINTIFNKAKIINMICKFSDNMNLLIEPPNKTVLENFIVPPITTYADFIKYLDDHINIYEDSYYRLFFDFERTYILSGKGIATYAKGEKKYPVWISILDNYNHESKFQGLEVDNDIGRYIVDVDEIDTTLQKDNGTTTLYNKIVGIDNSGQTYSEDISSDRTQLVSKTSIQRTKNLNNVSSLRSSIENKAKVVNFIKNNLDSSIFTINREYIINHYKEDTYNGNYILTRKRELLLKETDNFIMSTILTFSQVNS